MHPQRVFFLCPEGGIYTFTFCPEYGIKTVLAGGDTTIKNKGKRKAHYGFFKRDSWRRTVCTG